MIKALSVINNRKTLIIGLSRMNCERILEGKPIGVDVQSMLTDLPNPEKYAKLQDIVIFGGETEESMKEELDKYLRLPFKALKEVGQLILDHVLEPVVRTELATQFLGDSERIQE